MSAERDPSFEGGGPAEQGRATPGNSLKACVYAFEEIDESLPYLPLSARRALDERGMKLSLEGWLSLDLADRKVLALAGAEEQIAWDVVDSVLFRARPAAVPIAPIPPLPAAVVPPQLGEAGIRVDAAQWAALRPLDRYALVKVREIKLQRAFDEIAPGAPRFSHLSARGEAHMVDVAAKAQTERRAVATARVKMAAAVLDAIVQGTAGKGDVFAAARIAGIMAAKRTPELIPLCHVVALTRVEISFATDVSDAARGTITVRAIAQAVDRTGVEMEALVAASVAALTIYDMVKSADRWMTIEHVALEEKSGGRSGEIRRPKATE